MDKRIMNGLVCAAALTGSGFAQAEMLSLTTAMSADLSLLDDVNLQAGIKFGDYSGLGARALVPVNEQWVAYGGLMRAEIETGNNTEADGMVFGGGALMQLPLNDDRFDALVGASYHFGSPDYDQSGVDLDLSDFAIFSLLSGDLNEQVRWYGGVGIEFISYEIDYRTVADEDDTDTELSLNFGLLTDFGDGEIYGGIEIVDEAMLTLGFRLPLQPRPAQ